MGNSMEQFMERYGDQLASVKKRMGNRHVLSRDYIEHPAHRLDHSFGSYFLKKENRAEALALGECR